MDIRTILIDHGIDSRSIGTIDGNYDELIQRITDLDEYVDNAFRDGVIEEVEARKIQIYVNLLDEQNKVITERYNLLYNHVDLEGGYTKDELFAAKVNYETGYQNLLEDISTAIADMKSTPEEISAIDSSYFSLIDAVARLEKAMQNASDAILGKRSQQAEDNAKEYADGLKDDLYEITDALDQRLASAEGYVDGTFRDGVITEFEAKNIRSYLESLNLQKTQLDIRFNEIHTNIYLDGVPKLNLADAKQKYDIKHYALIDLINIAISDNAATPQESDNVRQGFVELDTALSLLVSCFEKAIDQLSKARADAAEQGAKDYVDEELEDVRNNVVYKIEIISSNGLAFKNGQISTTLEARVYRGAQDVTDQFDANRFRWRRVSTDTEGDERWNVSYAGGRKSITITPADVRVRATFNCSLYEDSSTDTTAPTTITSLAVNDLTSTSVKLSWDHSTSSDVMGYDIYEGSTHKGFTYDRSFVVTGLSPNTQYNLTVMTRDMAGNPSLTGVSRTITTLAN